MSKPESFAAGSEPIKRKDAGKDRRDRGKRSFEGKRKLNSCGIPHQLEAKAKGIKSQMNKLGTRSSRSSKLRIAGSQSKVGRRANKSHVKKRLPDIKQGQLNERGPRPKQHTREKEKDCERLVMLKCWRLGRICLRIGETDDTEIKRKVRNLIHTPMGSSLKKREK